MKKLLKITKFLRYGKAQSFQTVRYLLQILIAQIEDLNKDYVKISGPYLICFLRNKPSKSVTLGSGRMMPRDASLSDSCKSDHY